MLWIERREKMLDKIFEAARQRMETTTQWSNYNEIVHQMVEEAVGYLGAKKAAYPCG